MDNGAPNLHINFEKIPTSIYSSADTASKSVAREISELIRSKQKEGKKRMKSIGRINIPQEAFIEVLKAQ